MKAPETEGQLLTWLKYLRDGEEVFLHFIFGDRARRAEALIKKHLDKKTFWDYKPPFDITFSKDNENPHFKKHTI